MSEKEEILEKEMGDFYNLPIESLYENFECNHCGSKHLIAVSIKCTKCGRESWWGYWPKEE